MERIQGNKIHKKKWEVSLNISNSGVGKYVPEVRGREARKKFGFNEGVEQ